MPFSQIPKTMTAEQTEFLSAAEQGRLIRNRKLSPVELVQHCLDRIERWDPVLRAYITVCAESALAEARTAEREISAGRWRGPLHGLPFGVKDQLNSKGVLTTLGSRVLANNVPDHDAAVIERLKAAGAILIGKENLHEFGKGGTVDFAYGQPRNPWDINRNPAGSSSGSGIAVSAGFSSGSLGEDTGGSVRSPAAANGIVDELVEDRHSGSCTGELPRDLRSDAARREQQSAPRIATVQFLAGEHDDDAEHTHADRTNPIGDACCLAQRMNDAAQIADQGIADIDDAQIAAARHFSQPGQRFFDGASPIDATAMASRKG